MVATHKKRVLTEDQKRRQSERSKLYRERNREKIKARARHRWHSDEAWRKKRLEYVKNNPEIYKQATQRYAKRNPEKVRRWATNWAKRNPERNREVNKKAALKYRAKNPHITRAIALKRLARKRNQLVESESQAIKNYFSEMRKKKTVRCYYCKRTVNKFHIDHITPLSRGGLHSLSNICFSCVSCNTSKNSKDATGWSRGKFSQPVFNI